MSYSLYVNPGFNGWDDKTPVLITVIRGTHLPRVGDTIRWKAKHGAMKEVFEFKVTNVVHEYYTDIFGDKQKSSIYCHVYIDPISSNATRELINRCIE